MIKNTTPTVDAIGKLNISGDILPPSWLKAITYTTTKGKKVTDFLAAYILANIRYWYTPTTTRDPQTDDIASISKKFNSDKLQKSYSDYAELTGSSKRQVRDSFETLVRLNLISVEFRQVLVKNTMLYNVMFVEPNVERITEITYNHIEKGGHTKIRTTPLRESVPPSYGNPYDPPTEICNTYTKITTENTTEITTDLFFGEEKKHQEDNSLGIPKREEGEKENSLEELREERTQESLKELTSAGLIQFLIDKNNGCIPIYYNDLIKNSNRIINILQRIEVYGKQSKIEKNIIRLESLETWINRFTLSKVLEAIETIEGSIALGICSRKITPKYFLEALLRNVPEDTSHLEPVEDNYVYVCKCGHKTQLHDDLRFCSVCGTEVDYLVTQEGERIYS